ncbi:MAG TPA: HutD family protein [Bacteroidia bacterium]|nr:HutD family protein [Bacteroidia bacterium]
MKIHHSKPKDRTTAQWAGGTTTQLAIFPEGAEYTKFNFLFRISSATVETEESTFTFMPGVTRHLMILDGVLDIDHKGRYKKHLEKFDYDVFDGEWPTTAKGKVTDFNLMTKEKTSGKLQAITLKDRGEETIAFKSKTSFSAVYLLTGSLRVIIGTGSAELKKGDFLFCDHEGEEQIMHMQSTAATEMILVTVQL